MQHYLTLNPAAVENLLDGALPPFATVQKIEDGWCVCPLKAQRENAVAIIDASIPIDSEAIEELSGNLAVRLDDSGNIIIYRTSQARKAFQPSARITKGDREASAPKKPRIVRQRSPRGDEKPQGFLIRGEEVRAKPAPSSPIRVPVRQESEDAMAQRLEDAWKRPSTPPNTLHFVQTEVEPLGVRRHIEKVIEVPVSFDRRRGLGMRNVEVVIKRRRFAH